MTTEQFNKAYLSTPNFRIENPNPRWATKRGFRWDTADCVIRSLANAVPCSWLDAFDYLTAKARRDYSVLNDGPSFRKWLTEDGGVWVPCKAEKGKTRMKVIDFAKAHPNGRYIVSIASHETAVVDGVILDAFNCGESAVVGYIDLATFHAL